VHHESQVRQHELPGRIQVGLAAETNGEGDLVFLGQNWNLRNPVYIRVEAPHGARENQSTGLFSD
jgi:hypothetical protein